MKLQASEASHPKILQSPNQLRRRKSTRNQPLRPSSRPTKDYISFKGQLWNVPRAFRGERVAIRPLTAVGRYGVFFGSHQIATIDLTSPKSVSDVPGQVSAMSLG